MLDEKTQEVLKNKFGAMKDNVSLLFFNSDNPENCEYCKEINQLLEELSTISNGKILYNKYNLASNEAKNYSIKDAPAIVMFGSSKRNIHYYGIPAGYEFNAFIQTILDISKGEPDVSKELKDKVKAIDFPVHIKVFVSPSCPYCPGAMKVANDFALLNDKIIADVYEVTEFREIAMKYDVSGVPKTVINDIVELSGAYPPDIVLQKIQTLKE
ncbi:MAG: thioredoxin family protein [Candidatus ainarchaeum sp.]|nr:thioredoxin family protein [Candidatus ainarchaeum sp.]